jgi:hypothetical protein
MFETSYTLHMNDIVNYEGRYFSTDAYAADLKGDSRHKFSPASRILTDSRKDSKRCN